MNILNDGLKKIQDGLDRGSNFSKVVGSITRNKKFKRELEIKTNFLNKYISIIRPIDRVWCILNNINVIQDVPVCEYCKKENVKFKRDSYGFSNTCSFKCGNILGLLNTKTPEAIKKAEETKKIILLEKYGVNHVSKIPGINKKKKRTALKNFGSLKAAYYDTASKTIKKKYKVDNISSTPENKKKKRINMIKNIEKRKLNGHQLVPNYNPDGCRIINKYGLENNYNFQHAENGGEFYIKELGYWVDGYDKEKNIIIEIDEPYHFSNGNLKEKDIKRQNEIVDLLNCKFIRIKYEKSS